MVLTRRKFFQSVVGASIASQVPAVSAAASRPSGYSSFRDGYNYFHANHGVFSEAQLRHCWASIDPLKPVNFAGLSSKSQVARVIATRLREELGGYHGEL